MSNPATNANGSVVSVGDTVTIHGACATISGTTPSVNEVVTFKTILGDTVTVVAGDLNTLDEQPIAPNYGRGTVSGNAYKASDPATINGTVTAITNGPWGFTGQLSVTTFYSGTAITVSSGSADSHG